MSGARERGRASTGWGRGLVLRGASVETRTGAGFRRDHCVEEISHELRRFDHFSAVLLRADLLEEIIDVG